MLTNKSEFSSKSLWCVYYHYLGTQKTCRYIPLARIMSRYQLEWKVCLICNIIIISHDATIIQSTSDRMLSRNKSIHYNHCFSVSVDWILWHLSFMAYSIIQMTYQVVANQIIPTASILTSGLAKGLQTSTTYTLAKVKLIFLYDTLPGRFI